MPQLFSIIRIPSPDKYSVRSLISPQVPSRVFARDMGTVCSCHGDCCGIVGEWRALGGAHETESARAFKQISHYLPW